MNEWDNMVMKKWRMKHIPCQTTSRGVRKGYRHGVSVGGGNSEVEPGIGEYSTNDGESQPEVPKGSQREPDGVYHEIRPLCVERGGVPAQLGTSNRDAYCRRDTFCAYLRIRMGTRMIVLACVRDFYRKLV